MDGLLVMHDKEEWRPYRSSYVDQMRRGIAQGEHVTRYKWFLGYAMCDSGDVETGRRLLAEAAASESRDFPVECLNAGLLLCQELLRLGQFASATQILRASMQFHSSVREDFEVRVNDFDAWTADLSKAVETRSLVDYRERMFAY